jgi:hypothetical protein
MMPWVENKLSKGREGKKEPKVTGLNKNDMTLTAITMNKFKDCIKRGAFMMGD